jgi:hypothetical protein
MCMQSQRDELVRYRPSPRFQLRTVAKVSRRSRTGIRTYVRLLHARTHTVLLLPGAGENQICICVQIGSARA